METAFFLALGIAFSYLIVIGKVITSWMSFPSYRPLGKIALPDVTVVVPMRNEVSHLKTLVHHLKDAVEHYKKSGGRVEILLINDHSSDNTKDLWNQIQDSSFQMIDVPEGQYGKKAAITLGVQHSKYDLILCTDADCLVPPSWIYQMATYLQSSQSVMVTSMVGVDQDHGFLRHWQSLDMMAMMAMTVHGAYLNTFHLANGANMIFRKEAFEALGGYSQNMGVASGDDIFLIHQMVRTFGSNRVRVLKSKEAIVKTKALRSWKKLIQQKIRWAGKTKNYQQKSMIWLQGYLVIYSFTAIIMMLSAALIYPILLFYGMFLLFVKGAIDFLLLQRTNDLFEDRRAIKWFFPVFITYNFYILGAAIIALINPKYNWKGRVVR